MTDTERMIRMALMTGEQYLKSIEELKLNIFMFGEKTENAAASPVLAPALKAVGAVCDLAADERYKDVMTTVSPITGERINRFNHIFQNSSDLIKKLKMQRLCGGRMAACLHRSAGLDAMNALYSTAFETDKKYGTRYFDNLRSFLAHVQGGDLTVDGAVADPKEPASESESSEIRLRVVERKPGGVVVRGAKMQNVGVCASHEIIAIPSGAVKEADKAIAFAVPTDAEGIMIIIGSQSDGGARPGDGFYGETEALVVFDDVFVPNERIFLNGETEFTETLADRFAAFHRQSCSGSKSGIGDVLIGAIALAAQFNGSDKDSYVRNNLLEMTHLNETIFSCGVACSAMAEETEAGGCSIDLPLTNVCRQNVTRFPYEITRLARSITLELMIIVPSESEFRSERLGEYIDKYFKAGVRTEYRLKIMRLIGELMFGSAAIDYLTEPMELSGGDGKNAESRQRELEDKKRLAGEIAGIDG